MKNIIVFSGTTEGRKLSQILSRNKIYHTVCVATEYGKEVMEESEYAYIHTGRIDKDSMQDFIEADTEFVIDATHPYATLVSDNLKAVTKQMNIPYIRISRSESVIDSDADIKTVDSFEETPELLKAVDGNILLTTGSKELQVFNFDEEILNRIYVRVIPSEESIAICKAAGIPRQNVIAMHGPFSVQMNEAILKEYKIRCLVTKESGVSGGFGEKLTAAKNCNCQTIVVGRPDTECGVTIEKALEMLGVDMVPSSHTQSFEGTISLIGMGMGDHKLLTMQAIEAINSSEAVFGPQRLLSDINNTNKYPFFRASDILPIIKEKQYARVAILFSGDCGFYSGATSFISEYSKAAGGYEIICLPGISSVSYFASKLGVKYSDTCIYSIHGKKDDTKAYALLKQKLMENAFTFVLLSGDEDIRELGRLLEQDSDNFLITIGSSLSYPDERIFELTVEEAINYKTPGLYIAYITNRKPQKRKLINYYKDSEFERNETPMTKETIRHEVVRLLELKEGDTVYDIGSGTGSVSIEIASLSTSLNVYAIEKKDEALSCMSRNIEKFACNNITLIKGCAEKIVEELPPADAVFVGGSSGKLTEIIDKLNIEKSVRIVVTAVSLETVAELEKLENRSDVRDYQMKMIGVTNIRKVASHSLIQAENPIYICAFDLIKQVN